MENYYLVIADKNVEVTRIFHPSVSTLYNWRIALLQQGFPGTVQILPIDPDERSDAEVDRVMTLLDLIL